MILVLILILISISLGCGYIALDSHRDMKSVKLFYESEKRAKEKWKEEAEDTQKLNGELLTEITLLSNAQNKYHSAYSELLEYADDILGTNGGFREKWMDRGCHKELDAAITAMNEYLDVMVNAKSTK